jgi:hypothetical protein
LIWSDDLPQESQTDDIQKNTDIMVKPGKEIEATQDWLNPKSLKGKTYLVFD